MNESNYKLIKECKFQTKQPQQLIVKFKDGCTLLFFTTGKFRVNAKRVSRARAIRRARIITRLKTIRTPTMELQTMTAVYTLPHKIILIKLADMLQDLKRKPVMHFEPEIFPAVQIIKYKPIHINVFASGSIVICGLKSRKYATKLINGLMPALTASANHNVYHLL